ncbi:antileukoproteinase isoform X1 [Sarcophilus harrisii]|uniref:WAP domain-containing protein n=1 Tax=Sarcophilus harrisii TaxID=9305 RepID=A0A7N4NLE4_SARHA|nr:antileukoproteinase isoform X1 [Sarcophilus harrisii]
MKSGSLFFFVAFLAIGFLTVSGTLNAAKGGKVKSGSCPLDNVRCFKEEPDECNNDEQCPQEQKCCYYYCGLKCVNPGETGYPAASKPGKCPIVHIRCAMENPPNACENDGECKGRLKCCTGACGKTCMAPEVVSKPGKCPTVLGRCMMENPPNACENDGECKGRLKCCTGMCGKICMAPKA